MAKYENALPSKMVGDYLSSINDLSPLHMREEIALMDSRLIALVGDLENQVNRAFWAQVEAQLKSLETALYEDNPAIIRARLRDLGDSISVGKREAAAWDTVLKLVGARNTMVRDERRHMIQTETLYTVREGMGLVNALLASVRTHVRDENALAAIREDFLELTADQASTHALPGTMSVAPSAVNGLLSGDD